MIRSIINAITILRNNYKIQRCLSDEFYSINFGLWEYKFLRLDEKDKKLINYVIETAKKLAENEHVKIFEMSEEELNSDKPLNIRVGAFIYIKDNLIITDSNMIY